jgi:hypothetical protein
VFLKSVFEGEHGEPMPDRRKPVQWFATDPPGRRVGRRQSGKLPLQILQLPEQRIEFGVGQFRTVVLVIEAVVVFNLVGQPDDAGVSGFRVHAVSPSSYKKGATRVGSAFFCTVACPVTLRLRS